MGLAGRAKVGMGAWRAGVQAVGEIHFWGSKLGWVEWERVIIWREEMG